MAVIKIDHFQVAIPWGRVPDALVPYMGGVTHVGANS